MERGRVWQLFCAASAWLLLHVGGAYAVWWCIVWRAEPVAWIVAGVLFSVSWVGTEIGYRLAWTERRFSPSRWASYLLALGGAIAVQSYIGDNDDEALRWQRRWFVPLALSGFILPLVALGWQGMFAAGSVRFLVHRYGLPASSAAGRVALDRIGRRMGVRIPCPDVALLVVRSVRSAARLGRRWVPTTA